MGDMVEVLIRAGADVNHTTKLGTPLLVASRGGEAGGMKYVSYQRSVEMLIKAGANVNSVDSNGRTPLIACSQCYVSTWTKLLLDSRADVNVAKPNGETALMYAAGNSHYESLQELIKAGADVKAFDSQGLTVLMYTFSIANYKLYISVRNCCEALIEAGADVKAIDQVGKTALHHAAKNCRPDCLYMLLMEGADVNRRCNNGNTALIEAASLSCIRVLLRSGADVNIYNNSGYNALTSFLVKPGNLDETAVMTLFAAGETDYVVTGRHQDDVTIPDCLVQLSSAELRLMSLCRHAIRKYLLNTNCHQHLFGRVPLSLESYLLFDVSLEETHDEDE